MIRVRIINMHQHKTACLVVRVIVWLQVRLLGMGWAKMF